MPSVNGTTSRTIPATAVQQPYLRGALAYFGQGWSPIPIRARDKTPLVSGFHGKTGRYPKQADIAQWASRFPDANLALRMPDDVIGIDVDAYDDKHGDDQLAELEAEIEVLPDTPISTARTDGISGIRFFRVPAGMSWVSKAHKDIEIICAGNRYAVVAPSWHQGAGAAYRWLASDGTVLDSAPHPGALPPLPDTWVAFLLRKPTRDDHDVDQATGIKYEAGQAGTERGITVLAREIEVDWPRMREQHGWNNALFASAKRIYELVAGGELADEPTREALIKMALDAGMYAEKGDAEARYRVEATIESGRHWGLERSRQLQQDELGALPDGYRPTDVGNAQRLVAIGEPRMRYVRIWGKWAVYSGGVWKVDPGSALASEIAKEVPRSLFRLAADHGDPDVRKLIWKHATGSETKGAIGAMLTLARGDTRTLVEHSQLDTHPHLLNVQNGEVNLRTGELIAHNPDHLLTMQAPVYYDPEAEAPLWLKCVERWQPDPAVRAYLQRAIGSGLTGYPVERLFINVGDGGNGKSKFYGAIETALGPYYVVPHKSLLVAQRHESHPTHLASLFGARLVVAAETGAGDFLNEDGIKNLTGGDALRARRMREDEWTFKPTHTAFMHTNHLPQIKGTDDGIWRRIRAIRWSVTIPDAEKDEHLAEKLATPQEQRGILAWMVEGARMYLESGLGQEPDAVAEETAQYRRDQDNIGRWLSERSRTSPGKRTPARVVYLDYCAWCQSLGEEADTEPKFAARLLRAGFVSKRYNSGKAYNNLELLPEDALFDVE